MKKRLDGRTKPEFTWLRMWISDMVMTQAPKETVASVE
jgi:hypothetical protein